MERRAVEVYGHGGRSLGTFGLVSPSAVYVNGREEGVFLHPEKHGAYIFVREPHDIQDVDIDPRSEAGRQAIEDMYRTMQK